MLLKVSKKRVLYSFLFIIVFFAVSEIALRLLGYKTSEYAFANTHPNMKKPHDMLGWQLPQGVHTFTPFHPGGKITQVTVLPSGQRATSSSIQQKPSILFLGGHSTFGWGISDEDTYTWKLQEAHPELTVKNLAVPGYGIYQNLLSLEHELATESSPGLIFLEFDQVLLLRNLGPGKLIKVLRSVFKSDDTVTPYVSFDKTGKIERHGPVEFRMPMAKDLVIANIAQDKYIKWSAGVRREKAKQIAHSLIQEMDSLCKSYDSQLVVLFLQHHEETQEHMRFFTENRISYLDYSRELEVPYLLEGAGTPDEKAHAYWASQIGSDLLSKFQSLIKVTPVQR